MWWSSQFWVFPFVSRRPGVRHARPFLQIATAIRRRTATERDRRQWGKESRRLCKDRWASPGKITPRALTEALAAGW